MLTNPARQYCMCNRRGVSIDKGRHKARLHVEWGRMWNEDLVLSIKVSDMIPFHGTVPGCPGTRVQSFFCICLCSYTWSTHKKWRFCDFYESRRENRLFVFGAIAHLKFALSAPPLEGIILSGEIPGSGDPLMLEFLDLGILGTQTTLNTQFS